jgi:hypothetical protein
VAKNTEKGENGMTPEQLAVDRIVRIVPVRHAPQFQKRKIFRSAVALFLAARFTGDEEPARRCVRSSVVCCGIT